MNQGERPKGVPTLSPKEAASELTLSGYAGSRYDPVCAGVSSHRAIRIQRSLARPSRGPTSTSSSPTKCRSPVEAMSRSSEKRPILGLEQGKHEINAESLGLLSSRILCEPRWLCQTWPSDARDVHSKGNSHGEGSERPSGSAGTRVCTSACTQVALVLAFT